MGSNIIYTGHTVNVKPKYREVSSCGWYSYTPNMDQHQEKTTGPEKVNVQRHSHVSYPSLGSHLFIFPFSFSFLSLSSGKPKGNAQFKRRKKSITLLYITMIHSDNSVDRGPLLFFFFPPPQQEENKIVALIRNTCSVSVSVSISNIQTVTAVAQAVIWKSSGARDVKGRDRRFFEHFFPHRALSRSNSWKHSVAARAYNISHMLFKEPPCAIDFFHLEPRNQKGKGLLPRLLSIRRSIKRPI